MASHDRTDVEPHSLLFSGKQRVYRLKFVLKLLLITMLLLLICNLNVNTLNIRDFAILMTIAVLALLYFFVSQDTTSIISAVLIWGLTILAAYVGWNNGGLFSSTVVVFPCMIILAIILSNKFVYIPIFLFTVLTFFFFPYADSIGLLEPIPTIGYLSTWGKAADLSIMIAFFSLSTLLFSKDFRKIFNQLHAKNKQLERALMESVKLSNYDELTQLPNEHACNKDLTLRLESCARSGKILAFITLDLRSLSAINNTFGHSVGDMLIQELAIRLSALAGQDGDLYRFQGNEFVMLKSCSDYQEASASSQQLLQATSEAFNILEYEIETTGSIGIAIAPFDGESLELLRKKSHIALFNAKENRPNEYQFFDEDMTYQAETKYQLIRALKKAIENREFELYYQPKVELSSKNIIGAEALIRWDRPDHGMIPPDIFIALAEDSGLITDITKWVIKEAISACKDWHQAGLKNLTVAINLSAVDFRRGNLPQLIFNALSKEHLSPEYLELEITESILCDDISHVQSQIEELHGKGVTLAIDDFGTGYSNLSYLSQFNVTTLKIDQSFVRNINDSEYDYHIIKAIIQMSHSLGIANVAEGIEDSETLDKLATLNCQFGQGYLWAKPLPNSDFVKLIQENIQ